MKLKIEQEDDFSFDLSKPNLSREQIQQITGMKPINLEYYRKAMIHSSMQKIILNRIHKGIKVADYLTSGVSNERLEFLGDAIFNSIITNIIYKKYPDKDEGFLTRIRTKIVRSSHCVLFSKKIGLDKFILTGNKIIEPNENKKHMNERVLEDAFEAFIGALYLDLGYKYTEHFIKNLVDKYVNFNEILKDDNYKDILMRYTQAYGYKLPIYDCIMTNDINIGRKFNVSVSIQKDSQKFSDLFYDSDEESLNSKESKESLNSKESKESLNSKESFIEINSRNFFDDSDILCNYIEEYDQFNGIFGKGIGTSKKEAEQNAAKNLFDFIILNHKGNLRNFISRDT